MIAGFFRSNDTDCKLGQPTDFNSFQCFRFTLETQPPLKADMFFFFTLPLKIGGQVFAKLQQPFEATQRSARSLRRVLENFCENLCLHNRIFSVTATCPRAKNQIRQNLCDLPRRQNSVAEKKFFTKIL